MISRKKFIRAAAVATGAVLQPAFCKTLVAGDIAKSKPAQSTSTYFPHGVASGDADENSVIIWSRISAGTDAEPELNWQLSTDKSFDSIVKSGKIKTNVEKDFILKQEIKDLNAGEKYFYRFQYKGNFSPAGTTKTAGKTETGKLNFAVVSCSDFSAGYFNALGNIARRTDIDAVIYLGDYIYEGVARKFDESLAYNENEYEATHFNRNRNWWLQFYRYRYSLTRQDPDMQAAHQAHMFYTIWDDHELANNTWSGGAQGHDPERDGEWADRISAARQAYSEWMPIRGNAEKIYRSVRFGKDLELFFLDTRLEGRDKQVKTVTDPALFQSKRTLLGTEQKQWLFKSLSDSTCHWKVLANQVIFSEINIQWANAGGMFAKQYGELKSTLLDYWEGYPAERDAVIDLLSSKKINNTIILSASMHCAMAFDITRRATRYSRNNEKPTYDPSTGNGSVGVEFAAPSITSANFDDRSGGQMYANLFESMINKKIPAPIGYNPNPHMKFADLQRHGYFVLQVTQQQAVASYFFSEQLVQRSAKQISGPVLTVKSGKNRLEKIA